MEITEKILKELQNRLKVGSRRGVHLNAIPSRSMYKFDLARLSYIDQSLPNNFINSLLTEQPLNFKISWKGNVPDLNSLNEEDQFQLMKISRSFENLINQTDAIESEKGINTFGFGFPLLIRRDQSDKKLTVAPILIWSLRIKRDKEFNTWVIHRDEEDSIYINEVLINHLQNDANIELEKISSDYLDDGLIDKEELLDICTNLIGKTNSTISNNLRSDFEKQLVNVKTIGDKKHYEKLLLNSNNSFIEFGGLFSIFEVQKQNIIQDYEELTASKKSVIDVEKLETNSFQPISSVETDPSQQEILHALKDTRNILIQGPPGTGKSQTLSAILINALENHKKTIVVCEKKTALEVLHNSLIKRDLGSQSIIIKDTTKDRRNVVNSVRERVNNSVTINNLNRYSRNYLKSILSKTQKLINSINREHLKLDEKLIGNDNWTDIVGKLLSEIRENQEDVKLNIKKEYFKYKLDELSNFLEIIKKGHELYKNYHTNKKLTFLNPQKLNGNNPFLIEQKIKESLDRYSKKLKGENSLINNIIKYHTANPDLFDLNLTNSFTYKVASVFSNRKKRTIKDQKELLILCTQLANEIKTDDWFLVSIDNKNSESIIKEVNFLLSLGKKYFTDNNSFFDVEFAWFQFYYSLSTFERTIIDELKDKTDWKKVFLLFYFNSMLEKHANGSLPTNDNNHNDLKKSLKEIEKEQIKYIKKYWHSKQINAVNNFRNSNLSIEALYNKRSSKKHKRFSLRNIVKFDIDLFTSFFPIILTTPDICSNLFKGKNKYFDIVMFDEASQLKLEDNLPALLKGKQVIIAGDEHQMPPSNYFSKIFEGSDDDDDDDDDNLNIRIFENELLSVESLLEFAEEFNFEKKYLDFHYRSKHPFLIDFSNYAFYNQRLKPLPNSFEYTPIKHIQVDGTYSDHTNEVEAETVLSIIANNINRLPNGKYPSVGIATFNIHQRNLILNKINERRKFEEYADFNEKIIELEENGLFVKNLENIQGDERDVIILTTTYGINKDRKFAQRFGSINHKKGYKLLNVIITRAKYKIYVVSSIPENIFLNYKTFLEEEGSNNKRAVFYAYLAYSKAVSESDNEKRISILNALAENTNQELNLDFLNADLESPFEEEVYQALREHFKEDQIIPQLQFAGFRIDLVYDSKLPNIPKIAIECDGAAFHSSQEAYVYDRHRQNILEGYGFVFHRIWSTNWWRDPKREINKLVNFIKSIEKNSSSNFVDESKIGQAFTDKIDIIPKESQNEITMNQKDLIEFIDSTGNEKFELSELLKKAI